MCSIKNLHFFKGWAKPNFFFCKWKVNIHIIISLDVFDFFLNSMLVKIGILKTVGIFRYSESKGRQLVLLLRHRVNRRGSSQRQPFCKLYCCSVFFAHRSWKTVCGICFYTKTKDLSIENVN